MVGGISCKPKQLMVIRIYVQREMVIEFSKTCLNMTVPTVMEAMAYTVCNVDTVIHTHH